MREDYLAVKGNEALPHATAQTDPGNTPPSTEDAAGPASYLNKVRRFTTLQTRSAISQAMRSMRGIMRSSLL